MRKSWMAPSLALLAGLFGAWLRKKELETAFEDTGLLTSFSGVSAALAALCAAAVIASVIFALKAGKKYETGNLYRKAFRNESFLSFALSALCGAVITAAAAVFFLNPEYLGISGAVLAVFSAFAVLAGLSVILLAMSAFTQKDGSLMSLFSVIPSVFLCFWMAIEYRKFASEPSILLYCYKCIALAAAALAFYYAAGFVYGRTNTRMTVISHLAAVFFLAMTLADSRPLMLEIMTAGMLAFIFQNAVRFLRGMGRRDVGGETGKEGNA